MVIAEDGYNNFEASTLGTVSMEFNIVLYTLEYTRNILKPPQTRMILKYHGPNM
jgi:hypothetical protein